MYKRQVERGFQLYPTDDVDDGAAAASSAPPERVQVGYLAWYQAAELSPALDRIPVAPSTRLRPHPAALHGPSRLAPRKARDPPQVRWWYGGPKFGNSDSCARAVATGHAKRRGAPPAPPSKVALAARAAARATLSKSTKEPPLPVAYPRGDVPKSLRP